MKKITVPGVNKILGTFSTCSKGPAVCIIDGKKLEAEYTERDDNFVKACYAKTGECKKFQLGNNKVRKEDKWFNAVKGVYMVLQHDYPNLKCFDFTFDGNLLDCDGHIVYSAIAVATAKALTQSLKLNLSIGDMTSIIDSALKLVSVSGNVSDIITMLNNEPNRFVIYDGLKNSYKILEHPFSKSGYSMLLIDGNVPVSSLKEEALSYEKEIANIWHKYYGTFACHYIDFSTREFRDMLYSFNEEERHLCSYLYEEHKAAVNIESTIIDKDIVGFGKVLDRVRNSYEEYLEVTCIETDWIIKRAYEKPGCLGACFFFEGFCTKAAVIMKNECIPYFLENAADYEHIFGFKMTTQVVGDYSAK